MKLSLSFANPLLLVILLIATHLSLVRGGPRGARGRRGGRGGKRGDLCYGGQAAVDFYNKTLYQTSLPDTCGAEFACPLKNGNEEGRFVCRNRYHPVTQAEVVWTTCISVDKAWDTDECGCCEDPCPEPADFCVNEDDEDDEN